MPQSYQNLSKYFPRLNIDKLKTIAQRWVDDNANVPINRIVLYTYSSKLYQKRSKKFIETEYAVVFEILKEYEHKNYGMTFQELDDYHKTIDRGEIITPDPRNEFLDREENTPDHIDEFIHNTEYYETMKPENLYLSFMTKDFENVYWETPNFEFKKEWDLIPRWLVKKGVFMELSANVRAREPHEILFQVQTEQIIKKDPPTADIQKEAAEQHNKVFPCNPGTKWDQIEMALLPAEDKFMVKTPLGHGYYDHIELKLFNDRKKSKAPKILWGFLKEMAKRKGFFSLKGVQNFEKLSSNAKQLNKQLKQLFGINESIYKDRCDRIGGYKANFKISQISDNKAMISQKSLIDEELENPKYNHIKESSYYPEHSTFKKK